MLVITVIMSLVFVGGFTRVVTITSSDERGAFDSNGTDKSVFEEDNAGTMNLNANKQILLILGDSIGAGVGDERSLGIGGRVLAEMTFERADSFEVVNMSVPGTITEEMYNTMQRGDYDKAIEEAQYIIVSIGGNNLNRMRGEDSSLKAVEFEERLSEHLDDLSSSLEYVRMRNDKADLVVLGLYNPYGDTSALEDVRMLHEWNYQTRLKLLDYSQAYYVPLYDVFREHLESYLSIDNFHPSGTGYTRIALSILDVLGME